MHQSGGTTPHRGPSTRHDDELRTPVRLSASPSGRTPQWVVEEALEQQRLARSTPRERRREQRRTARVTRRTARRWARSSRRSRAWRASPAVGIVLLAVLWFTPGLFDRYALPVIRPHLPNASAPPLGVEAAGAPLGVPPVVADAGGYRFHESPDPAQGMVAFDPCRPIRVVVRPDHAPPGGQQLVAEAVGAVSAATGLRFLDAGTTDETPSDDRAPYQPDRYGMRWAPVLIAWADPAEVPDLAGNVLGRGGGVPRQAPGSPFVYVTGQVTLDAPALTAMMQRPDGPAQVRAVIMHELAHVVGLDHVDDPAQLMHPSSGGPDFAAGDRAGLARLGAGECVPRL